MLKDMQISCVYTLFIIIPIYLNEMIVIYFTKNNPITQSDGASNGIYIMKQKHYLSA